MIDRTLPPRSGRGFYSKGAMCEDFAFTYLAKYSGDVLSARCRQSIQRAYNPHYFANVARVNGGRPAYCIATWLNEGGPRVKVAIEGTTTEAQITNVAGGIGASSNQAFTGHVYSTFLTHAFAIVDEIQTNPNVQAVFNQPGCLVQLTGFSLGAGIAHVMHAILSWQYPRKFFECRGFGTPRVGTARFNSSTNVIGGRHNVYCGIDRLDVIPFCAMNGREILANTWADPVVNFATPVNADRWTIVGTDQEVRLDVTFADFVRIMRQRRQQLRFENPWFWHDVIKYRVMLNYLVERSGTAMDLWRFRYLEYNDDNNFGNVFDQAGAFGAAAPLMVNPNPPDFITTPATPEEIVVVQQNHRPPVQQVPMIQAVPAIDGGRRPTGTWEPRRVRDY